MELEVKAPIELSDGQHSGQITKVIERTDPYHYLDIWIRVHPDDVELKYGCPANISEKTKLGKLLMSFGLKLVTGSKVDPDKFLRDKKCSFLTMKTKGKDGFEYTEIVDGSVKPFN